MTDVISKQKRSEVMSHIRGRGNKETEIALMTLMRKHHIKGWRRHRNLVGKPDFTFPKERVVIFVDGCFWHCCPEHSTRPKNNRQFWEKKLAANKKRDEFVTRELSAGSWHVVRIWEHELKNRELVAGKIKTVLSEQSGSDMA